MTVAWIAKLYKDCRINTIYFDNKFGRDLIRASFSDDEIQKGESFITVY